MEWTKILNQVSSIEVKSVTDSLFKYGLIALLIGVLSSVFSKQEWVTIVIISVSVFFILFGSVFYGYFAIKHPEFLRSETFQTQKQAMELLGDNKNSNNKNLNNIPLVTNPKAANTGNDNPLKKNYE